jgi:CHAT domain-containing protein/tetratricopeptide (TPR) repeat protein
MSSIKQFASTTLFLIFLSGTALLAQGQDIYLELGKPIERELSGGESHRYKISVETGQFVYVVATQRGIDVVVRVFNSANEKLGEMDSPNGTTGNEPLPFIADRSGHYVLEIECQDKKARLGRYEIEVLERRNASKDDRLFVDGYRMFSEALNLLEEGADDSSSRFIAKRAEMISIFEQIQNLKQRAPGFSRIAELDFFRKEFAEAARYDQKSADLYEEAGLSKEAAEEYILVSEDYNWMFDSEKELAYAEKALSIGEYLGDPKLKVAALHRIGETYWYNLAEYRTAMDIYRRMLSVAEESKDYRGAAGALGQIGNVYLDMGDFARGLEAFQNRDRLLKEHGINGAKETYTFNYGYMYAEQGNFEQALEYFQMALAGFRSLRAGGDIQAGNGVAKALGNIGAAYNDLGDYDKGLEYLRQEREVLEERRLPLTENLLNTGKVYFSMGRFDAALANADEAQAWAVKTGNTSHLAMSMANKAEVYLSTGDLQKALEFSKQAVDLTGKFDLHVQHAHSLAISAKVCMRLGKNNEARDFLQRSIEEIEGLRTRLTSGLQEGSKFFADKAPNYLLLIEVLSKLDANPDAFETTERMKARMLLDILQNAKVDIAGNLTTDERENEKKLKRELSGLNSKLAKMPQETDAKRPNRREVEEHLNAKRLQVEDFETRLYGAHPELRVKRGEMKPIGLEETAGLLGDDRSALVEYVVGEDKTFLFVITKDARQKPALKVYTIDVKQKDLGDRIEAFRLAIEKGDSAFKGNAAALYDLLVRPAAAQLAGKTNIVIVPDGPLWNLPFQALQPSTGKYLVEQAAVSYAPSLTALREMQKKNSGKKTTDASLLAFGNPAVNKETSDKLKTVFMDESLEQLPEAERLVNTLGKMYGPTRSKIYTGTAAREETAKSESPKYRIVQFATHGILNNVSPMYSHLVLAQDEKDPNEDGLLEAWEMKDLDLKADLVILSACDTARGKISNGEGVIGMTWAMFIAGAPTTVASQWKVESSSTTELMLEFHRQLLAGKVSKAEALRRAELKLMKTEKYKHPVYWAGFVLVGDGS